jgi:hypothetical protein
MKKHILILATLLVFNATADTGNVNQHLQQLSANTIGLTRSTATVTINDATTANINANGTTTVNANNTVNSIRAIQELPLKSSAINPLNDYIAVLEASTGSTLKVNKQTFADNEILRSNAALSGAVPFGKELGINTATGEFYFKNSSGNWQLQPAGTTVNLILNADGTITINAGLGGTQKAIQPIGTLAVAAPQTDSGSNKFLYLDSVGIHRAVSQISTTINPNIDPFIIPNSNSLIVVGQSQNANWSPNIVAPVGQFIGQKFIYRHFAGFNSTLAITNTNLTSPLVLVNGKSFVADWEGSRWVQSDNNTNLATAWTIAGNAGTTQASNFLGTTDNVGLSFRTNNATRATLDNIGNFGINTTTPITKIQVNTNASAVDGISVRGNADWDAITLAHDGSTGYLNAGGIDTGFVIRTNALGSGNALSNSFTEQFRILNSGNIGLRVPNPLNSIHIGTPAIANTTGIRTNITSASLPTTETSYLAVNATGDIVRGANIAASTQTSKCVLSSNLNFGPIVGGLQEWRLDFNGTNLLIKRNHSNNGNTFRFINYWVQQGASGTVGAKDVTFPTATTQQNISFDSFAVVKAVTNNTVLNIEMSDFGGGHYGIQVSSVGGGGIRLCMNRKDL